MYHNQELQQSSGHEEQQPSCSRLGGMLRQPCMNGHQALLCCPAPHSSFRDLGQSSYLAKLKSHTRDLLWKMSRKKKDLVFLDSMWLLHWEVDSLPPSHQGSPKLYVFLANLFWSVVFKALQHCNLLVLKNTQRRGFLSSSIKKNYLFIWLHQVLVAPCGIFSLS